MKHKLLLLMMLLMAFVFVANANPVDVNTAREVAARFLNANAKAPLRSTDDLQLVTSYSTERESTAFHIFNVSNGFVIVAADDVAHPILAYSLDRPWPSEGNLPPQVTGFLDDLANQIEAASNQPQDRGIATEWSDLLSGHYQTRGNRTQVGPLLTTTWDQGQYYNAMCPEDANGPDGHTWAGCVATAMAQIINYHQYPIHGRGTHSYNTSYYGGSYGILSVDYANETYDYTNMPDLLSSESTSEEINAVARLMKDCGIAVNMNYGSSASGSNNLSARIAFVNNFLYSDSISYVCKQSFPFSDWDNLLRQQLVDNKPVYYGGLDLNLSVGHAFVCDGFNSDDYFHFNFGWGGNGDGWYRTSTINPGSYEFDSSQAALIDIMPSNNNSTILNYLYGKSYFSVDTTTLHVYYSLGLNRYHASQDYLYTDWDTLVFYSAYENAQLEFNLNRHPNAYNGTNRIHVYDGNNADSLLHQYEAMYNYWNGSTLNLDRTPLISTRGAFTIECAGFDGYDGFDFIVGEFDGCMRVSDVKAEMGNASATISWTENGDAELWQIEYGPSGFTNGTGIVLTADTTEILIENLATYVEYDVYIRPMCSESNYGEWSQKASFIVGDSYWENVVTSQPSGYQIGEDNDIYISTAEGLAWLMYVVNYYSNQLEGWTVHLIEDVDLYGHIWTPIRYFKGVFDGHGHIIHNLFVITDSNGGAGLFGYCNSPLINDVHLRNVYIKMYSPEIYPSGAIVADLDGNVLENGQIATIMNCSATGIVASGSAGGLVGSARNKAAIINCWSSCTVNAKTVAGGICGSGNRDCLINNCYTRGSVNTLGIVYAGAVVGTSEYTIAKNSYALLDKFHSLNELFAGGMGSEYYDLQWFARDDTVWQLLEPVAFEQDTTNSLIQALNNGVVEMNSTQFRTWVLDSENNNMPTFGDYVNVICPNVTNLTARNILGNNGEIGVLLSWKENGEATTWELQYKIQDSLDIVHILTTNNPDTIWGLTAQNNYLFSIRPICDSLHHGVWCDIVSHIVDRPYWTDVVTCQPNGYIIDANGNVAISSAEGFAWLISVVNGLNGENGDSFENKQVNLTQDIDIGQYKWVSINGFLGDFDGGHHIIKGLYINELTDYHGLFGIINGGNYRKIEIDSAWVKCKEYAGVLCGLVRNASIIDCNMSGIVQGDLNVGGIAGGGESGVVVDRCSTIGMVQAKHHYAGGIFGDMNIGVIRNSYSRCNVTINGWFGVGGLIGPCYSGTIENCYANGSVVGFMYSGGLLGILRSYEWAPSMVRNCYVAGNVNGTGVIIGSTDADPQISNCYGLKNNETNPLIGPAESGYENGYPIVSDTASFNNYGVLANAITVNGIDYTDLLSALNAWVDANNADSLYSHWVADSAMVNGGFPLLGCQVGHGISESETILVSIYPNPTNGQIKIEAGSLKRITITNMIGQTIYESNGSGNEFAYDFSKHKAGIYLVRIETANGMAVKKVSVIR